MVIGRYGTPHHIGHRYAGLMAPRRGHVLPQPYVVLREATMEEWVDTLRGCGLSEAEIAENVALVRPGANFYEVSTD